MMSVRLDNDKMLFTYLYIKIPYKKKKYIDYLYISVYFELWFILWFHVIRHSYYIQNIKNHYYSIQYSLSAQPDRLIV